MGWIDDVVQPPHVDRLVVRSGIVTSEQHPRLALGHVDVRVAVEFAALGTYPAAQPDGPIGNEFSGRIIEVGAGVDPTRIGERVLGIARAGGAASEVVVPASGAYHLHDRFPAEIAPLALTIGLTALCLDRRFEIGPGRVALVLASSNATGCVFAGMTRRRGGTAIAWTRDPAAVVTLRTAGFHDVIVSDDLPDAAALSAATGGSMADLVVGGRITPEGPWTSITPLLTDTGVAVRRPGTALGDWDPARARVFDVIAEAFDLFGQGDRPLDECLAVPLDRLVDDVRAGDLHLPVRVFDVADAQQAYELTTDALIPEAVVVRR